MNQTTTETKRFSDCDISLLRTFVTDIRWECCINQGPENSATKYHICSSNFMQTNEWFYQQSNKANLSSIHEYKKP